MGRSHSIPKKVHHIYWNWGPDGAFLPDEGPVPTLQTLQAWVRMHPDYDVHVWQRAESFAFVQQHFPELWPIFMGYPRHIQRCDMFRIMLLAHFGGVYADIDVMPFQSQDALFSSYPNISCICATEVILSQVMARAIGAQQPIRRGEAEHPIRLANYWIASAPHPILHAILDEMVQRAKLPLVNDYDVIYTTGPDVLTTVFHRDQLQHSDMIYIPESEAIQYFIHAGAGSWRQQPL